MTLGKPRFQHTTVEITSADLAQIKSALGQSRLALLEWRELHTRHIEPLVGEPDIHWDAPNRHYQAMLPLIEANGVIQKLDRQLFKNRELAAKELQPAQQLRSATMGKIDDWLERKSFQQGPKDMAEEIDRERFIRRDEAAFGLRESEDGLIVTKEQAQRAHEAGNEYRARALGQTLESKQIAPAPRVRDLDKHEVPDWVHAASDYHRSRDSGALVGIRDEKPVRELERDDHEMGI